MGSHLMLWLDLAYAFTSLPSTVFLTWLPWWQVKLVKTLFFLESSNYQMNWRTWADFENCELGTNGYSMEWHEFQSIEIVTDCDYKSKTYNTELSTMEHE